LLAPADGHRRGEGGSRMKKAIVVTIILLGLLGGAAMAVSPLLFRIPVIGENVLMQVVALPTGEESPLDWSLTTNPSFTVPQEGNIAKLSPSQVIIEGELRAKNTSSTREISFTFWSEAIAIYGDALDAPPIFQTILSGKSREYRSEGVEDYFSDIVLLQPGEEVLLTLRIFTGAEESAPFRGVLFTIKPIF